MSEQGPGAAGTERAQRPPCRAKQGPWSRRRDARTTTKAGLRRPSRAGANVAPPRLRQQRGSDGRYCWTVTDGAVAQGRRSRLWGSSIPATWSGSGEAHPRRWACGSQRRPSQRATRTVAMLGRARVSSRSGAPPLVVTNRRSALPVPEPSGSGSPLSGGDAASWCGDLGGMGVHAEFAVGRSRGVAELVSAFAVTGGAACEQR
jgi:hypothetical protein